MTTENPPKKTVRARKTKKEPALYSSEKPVLGVVGNTLWILANDSATELEQTLIIEGFDQPFPIEWVSDRNAFLTQILTGYNLLENGDFTEDGKKSFKGWAIDSIEGTLAGVDLAEEWQLTEGHTAFLLAAEDAPRPSFTVAQKIPVMTEVEYKFSGYFATQRAEGLITLLCYDENDQVVSEEQINIVHTPEYFGGRFLKDYAYIESVFMPVSGTQSIQFKIELGEQVDLSEPNAYLFFMKIFFGVNNRINKSRMNTYSPGAYKLTQQLLENKNGCLGQAKIPKIYDARKMTIDHCNNIYEIDLTNELNEFFPVNLLPFLLEFNIFDEKWYSSKNELILTETKMTPLEHFIEYGYIERRAPNRYFSIEKYHNLPNEVNPISVYINECSNQTNPVSNDGGWGELSAVEQADFERASLSGLFDGDSYLSVNQDVYLNLNHHPWVHYISYGWKEGRDPSPAFSTSKYLTTYKVREKIECNPLIHFLNVGMKNGLQYWPADGDEIALDKNSCNGILFIKSPNDPFTMIYRVEAIERHFISTGNKNIKSFYSNKIDKSILVHSLKVIVIVRAHLTPEVQSILNRARNFKVPIVFDIDDYVWDASNKNQLRSLLYKDKESILQLENSMEKWRRVILEADAITVSTWPLRKLASGFGKPVIVIPNSIPKKYQVFDSSFEKFTQEFSDVVELGYFSGTNTHQHDVDECIDALVRTMEARSNIHLRLVGHTDYLTNRLSKYKDRLILIPLLGYQDMLREISRCDIVIAPLETRNVFCDCKSELKLFEAALFSVPVVCSPTATYASTIVDGVNGYLAGDENEWYEKLLLLVDNPTIRINVGEKAKQTILPRFETENVARIFKDFVVNLKDNLQLYSDVSKTLASNSGKKKGKRLLSLVTILHNKSDELPDFFRGIESQLFDGCVEIILVDDLSTDNSVEIAENWSRYIQYSEFNDWITPVILRNTKNEGNCLSRNLGIDAASADIVIVIDADCVMSPNFFKSHLNAHLTGAGNVVIGYRGIETNGTPPSLVSTSMELVVGGSALRARNQDSFLLSDFVNCVTRNISFNKKTFPLKFDELFSYTRSPESGFGWEDVEFGYQLFKAGAQAVFLDNCFTLHVSHPYEGDDGEKAKRSAKNFRRLLDKHPDICLLNPGWVKTTGEAIQKWLERSKYNPAEIEDWRAIAKRIISLQKSNIIIKTKGKALRILTHKWHSPHQYELCKSQHEFEYLVTENNDLDLYSFESKNWDYSFRPRPNNIKYVRLNEIDFRDYDLIIGHFDENILHPEYCNGVLKSTWGQEFKVLLELRDHLPMVCICHGTPQFVGQYNIFYDKDDLGQIIEDSRAEMISLLGDTLVVLNSHQAQKEWQFEKSKVIWHGFQPSEFFPNPKDRPWLAMSTEKIIQRPVYNGYYLYKKCFETFAGYLPIDQLKVKDEDLRIARTADHEMWARAKFAKYRTELGRTWFYLNFTQRSPMPRIRGESMMSGVIPITTSNHDAAMFIKHGHNGFLFDTPDEFYEVISYIESHPELWEKWSINARLTAIKEFHVDRYLAEWQRIILEEINLSSGF